MSTEEEQEVFPRLIGGWCDGMGCSYSPPQCFCSEYLESREEYQRVFNKPWIRDDLECKIWEKSWRYARGRYLKD
ncbi:MAG: hypothetical protein KAS32_24050 [Candidatus Peribacteraceae bacterium]|nr:hypothetical protein [Candidatus Peribacteraceae bacterium]